MSRSPAVDPDELEAPTQGADSSEDATLELALTALRHWRLLVIGPLLAAAVAFGIASLLPPIFTARAAILPPQQQQGGAAGALMAQLGALAGSLGGLGGAGGAMKNPSDQFVALMQSTSVQDRLIDQYGLMKAYDKRFRMDVRKELEGRVRINVAKKDSLIVIEVDDEDPQRAAAMANSHVDELRRIVSTLAVSEAQRRRVFFETQLAQTRDKLAKAQAALQDSGVTAGTLRSEPRAATAAYARVQAEVAAAEVQLATLRGFLADTAHEVRQAQSTLGALRAQLARIENIDTAAKPGDADYVARYRDFKYQEMLFELMARQYEVARVDEAREGSMVQVVDVAQPPELKSRPRRGMIALGALVSTALLLLVWLRVRSWWRSGLARRTATSAA